MFYCENCRKKKKWPKGFAVSRGPCEICGKVADCYDVSSSQLCSDEEKLAELVETINARQSKKKLSRVSRLYSDPKFFEGIHVMCNSRGCPTEDGCEEMVSKGGFLFRCPKCGAEIILAKEKKR